MEEPNDIKEALMLKMIQGEISKEERSQLDRLLKQTDEEKPVFNELSRLWSMTTPREFDEGLDHKQGWVAVRDRMPDLRVADRAPVRKVARRRLAWSGAAIGSLLLLWMFNPFASNLHHIETAYGESQVITFADGSSATLNGGSAIQYPVSFDDGVRAVTLEGEAFFNIEPGAIPFIGQTPHAEVTVLGTAFNVRTYDDKTSVAVQEGRVQLQAKATQDTGLILEASEAGYLLAGVLTRDDSTGVEEGLDWLEGKLFFSESTVAQVAEELRRTMGIEIDMSPEIDATVTLSGTFDASEPHVAVEALCILAACTSNFENGTYYLTAPTR